MDKLQIVHDLAVAKLYGSDLPPKELVEEYRKIYNEILTNYPESNSDLAKVESINPSQLFS